MRKILLLSCPNNFFTCPLHFCPHCKGQNMHPPVLIFQRLFTFTFPVLHTLLLEQIKLPAIAISDNFIRWSKFNVGLSKLMLQFHTNSINQKLNSVNHFRYLQSCFFFFFKSSSDLLFISMLLRLWPLMYISLSLYLCHLYLSISVMFRHSANRFKFCPDAKLTVHKALLGTFVL